MSQPKIAPRHVIAVRNKQRNAEASALLRDVAEAFASLAQALETSDGILGALAGEGLANHLPALPKHIRDVIADLLTDEAAQGIRSDRLYFEASAAGRGDSEPPEGYIVPEGDERCGFVMDACRCMKRKGHDGLHACAHGGWRAAGRGEDG